LRQRMRGAGWLAEVLYMLKYRSRITDLGEACWVAAEGI
jgi:hypothetical protein